MFDILKPNFSSPAATTKNIIQRMARFDLEDRLELIGNEYGKMGFRTGFGLADQVLTHAIITSRANVDFVVDLDAKKSSSVLRSLKDITRETYALEFKSRLSDDVETVLESAQSGTYIAKDKVRNLLTINPLADWNRKALIEYILAHEVPVDPADMVAVQPERPVQAA